MSDLKLCHMTHFTQFFATPEIRMSRGFQEKVRDMT